MPSKKFSWISEEEDGWEDPVPVRTSTRRWWPWLPLALLLGISLFWGYRRLNQQVDEVSAHAMEDIVASYDLYQRAVANHDSEFFNVILSGGQMHWTVAEQRLFRQGLSFDRWPMGLVEGDGLVQLVDVVMKPDLREAEVLIAQQYIVDESDGLQRQVTLQQTAVFRRGSERWLLSPPQPEFWGEWQTGNGRFLTLIYPQRDAALARRLLIDLDDQLFAACTAFLEFQCLPEFRLTVRLLTDPTALAETADPVAMLRQQKTIQLPTPTLVGLPVDEAGYQALFRGYAAHVVVAAISQAVGWVCCERGLFQQAFLDKWLDRLQLRPWPLTPAEYGAMFSEPPAGLEQLYRYWHDAPALRASTPAWRKVYAVVDYLLDANPTVPLGFLHQQLINAPDLGAQLRHYGVYLNDGGLAAQRQWLRFAQRQMAARESPPLPAQNLQLSCRQQEGQQETLYRYDLQTDAWQPELADRSILFVQPLPDDSGVFVQEQRLQDQQLVGVIWRRGEAEDIFVQPINRSLFRIDSSGDKLLLYEYDVSRNTTSYSALDLGDCTGEACYQVWLRGRPFWSPDGLRSLLLTDANTLWLGNEKGQLQAWLGPGKAPFWLDDTLFGYVDDTALRLAQVDGGLAEVLAPVQELAAAVSANRLDIQAVKVQPGNRDRLFVAATQADGQALILAYDLADAAVAWSTLLAYEPGPYQPFFFSPDGRWLLVKSFVTGSQLWQLTLIDAWSGTTQTVRSQTVAPFPGYDWSADGQWLVIVQDGFLQLLAPAYGYQQLIVHDFLDCNFAVWVNSY